MSRLRRNRSKRDLPVVRRAHLNTFTQLLKDIGAPAKRWLRQARLPVLDESSDSYVPTKRYWEFQSLATRATGIGALGWEAGVRVGRNQLGRDLVARSERSPTLYHSLKLFCERARSESTGMWVGLFEQDEGALLCHHGGGNQDAVGWEISEQYVITVLLDVIRRHAGARWDPPEIRTRSPVIPVQLVGLSPNTRWLSGRPSLAIWLPGVVLHRPPLMSSPEAVPTDAESEPPPVGFVAALRAVLKAYLTDGSLRLEQAADLVGVSPRTLQRRLAEAGISYSELQDQARYEVAASMLSDPAAQIIDTAYATGYTDPSNFSRAFRRIAGVSPRVYQRRVWESDA